MLSCGLARWIGAFLILLIAWNWARANAQTTPTYQITAAYFQESNGVLSTIVPAGINGAQLALSGTLPTAAQQNQTSLLGCFYTGYGSTAGFPLSLPNGTGTEPLVVPASTIQGIPPANFTAANNYSVAGKVYFIRSGSVCDGTFDSTLTNQFTLFVSAPTLVGYSGPTTIPQTNSKTGVQAAPTSLALSALHYRSDSATDGSVSTVSFGSQGTSTAKLVGQNVLSVPVPAAFAASPVGTSASLSLCFTASPGSTYTVCTTPASPISLTVGALEASTGTIAATPSPVLTSGSTVLTAQFAPSPTTSAGAPAGTVNFAADGATIPPAKLVLDKTAAFVPETTSVTTPVAPTPVIAPAGGSFTSAQTITITDTAPNAAIYYTQDGSAPTTASTLYNGPFSISTTQTINAIAAVPGFLNSAAASAAFTITISPPTQLAFTVQPVTSPINTVITPAVQVSIEDAKGNIVTSASNPVTIALNQSSSSTQLAGTATVNAVNGVATFSDLSINNLGNNFTLQATSGNLTPATSTAFNITPPPITMMVQSALVGIASTLSGSFTLGVAAPAGGVAVNLSSSAPGNVTISPASVTVPQGGTTGSFTYTGVAAGSSTLSASATNYQTGTVQVAGTAAQVSLGTIPPVAPGQMVGLALSLATPAPAGGTTVTFSIANTKIATVTSSVFVPAGMQTAATNPQITGVLIGTTTVTANAPGYAPAVRAVDVTVVATINPGTTSINLSTATTTTLNISAPAPAGGITFTLSSDDPTVATVPKSVTVIAGSTSVIIPITGVKAGSTTIRADSPSITEATGTVNVYSAINGGSLTTGYDLETSIGIGLPVGPPNPTTVTITSNDPSVAVISTSPSTVGVTKLTFPNTTSSYVATIYVQGLKIGSTTLTISAPGYTDGTTTITVLQSGFVYYGTPNFSTTTFSTPTTQGIYPVPLNAGSLSVYNYGWTINPGSATINIPVTSSDTTVGTVMSPIVFHALDTGQNVTFQPAGVGTTNITIGTPPAGFNVASQYEQITATVSAPVISPNADTTGIHLQTSFGVYLPVAPPKPVTVTLTSGSPRVATLSTSLTAVGTATLTFPNVSSTYVGTIYVQGQSVGSSTLTESAPGYTSGTSTLTVDPSGVAYYGVPSFSTTTFSSPTSETAYLVPLNPGSLTVESYNGSYLNPGAGPLTVPITDSATSVGTISPTSLVFNTGDFYQSFTFQPVAAGTSNLTIGTPTGFTTPSQYTQITATVTAPAINVGGQTTGVHLQNSLYISLPVNPPKPVTVTVTSSNPKVATLSNSQTVAGVATLTFPNVTAGGVGTIYIQGQSVGTSTITVSAPGYTSGTNTLTVNPSGFATYGPPTFTTTTFSSPTQITVYASILDPNSLAVQNFGYPLNPGIGPVTVPITDSAPSVGTISANSLMFNTGDSNQSFTFKPVSAGTTNLALGTPAGFSTPSNYQSGTVTVTAPQITINNVITGVNLESGMGIYLPVSPPNPVTVTVTSNGPAIATISTDGTVVGGKTLTFPNVTGTSVGTIFIQGQTLGATTLTMSAPGYTNGNSTITVDPSGFVFYGNPSFTTSATAGPTGETVYASVLNPGTLTVEQFDLGVNPGIGTVNVPVSSSNTTVGTVSPSPLPFTAGVGAMNVNFQPLATGTSNINIGTPTGFSTPSQYTQATATVQ